MYIYVYVCILIFLRIYYACLRQAFSYKPCLLYMNIILPKGNKQSCISVLQELRCSVIYKIELSWFGDVKLDHHLNVYINATYISVYTYIIYMYIYFLCKHLYCDLAPRTFLRIAYMYYIRELFLAVYCKFKLYRFEDLHERVNFMCTKYYTCILKLPSSFLTLVYILKNWIIF